MRIEPEQVLKQNRIAAEFGIKKTNAENTLNCYQCESNCQNRSRQNKDQTGCVMRPDEQRKPKPGQTGCSHGVYRNDEVEAGQYRRETGDQDSRCSPDYVCGRV